MNLTRCVLLSLALSAGSSFANAPCVAANFGDGVCDCGCGTVDPDCGPPAPGKSEFTVCVQNHCASGRVPWEHMPSACMNSACGDGWADTAAGEVCDDGNALNSGGCAANCRSVTAGYDCGAGALGCRLAPVDAGQPDAGVQQRDAGSTSADAGTDAGAGAQEPDAGSPTGEQPGDAMPKTGCSAMGGDLLVLGLLLTRRRRSA